MRKLVVFIVNHLSSKPERVPPRAQRQGGATSGTRIPSAVTENVRRVAVATLLTAVVTMAFGSTAYAQQGGGQGPPKPVTVENPASDPVPVSGEVTVGNLPAVQDVEVTNFPAAPGAKQRVQIYDVTLIEPGDNGFDVFGFGKPIYTVPTGKRLIVETVSVAATDDEGVNYKVSLNGYPVGTLYFLLTTKGAFADPIIQKGRAALTTPATLIVNPVGNAVLTYQAIRDVTTATYTAGVAITVVGYLEDVP